MSTVTAPIAIKQGADLTILITVTDDAVPVDLTAYDVTALVKDKIGGATLIDFSASPSTVTTTTSGTCTLIAPGSVTKLLTPRLATLGEQPFGVYDVKFAGKTSGTIDYFVQGDVSLTAQVTP